MLYVKKLNETAKLPTCAHLGEDLGYDIYALEDVEVAPFGVTRIRTGIAAHWEYNGYHSPAANYGLMIRDRSSVASGGLFVVGGILDAGYRGEIIVLMRNVGSAIIDVKAGQKIAQMIPLPVLTDGVKEVDSLGETARGDKGFGSSDKGVEHGG